MKFNLELGPRLRAFIRSRDFQSCVQAVRKVGNDEIKKHKDYNVKSRGDGKERHRRQGTVIAVPGAEQWELWQLGEEAVVLGTSERCGDLSGLKGAWVALPSCELASVPVWLASSDPEVIQQMAQLQVESWGAFPKSTDEVALDTEVIERSENGALVHICAGGGMAGCLLGVEGIERCVPGFSLWGMPDDGVVVWRELRRWTGVVRVGGKTLLTQAFGARELNNDFVYEVESLVQELEHNKLLPSSFSSIRSITFWDVDPEDRAGVVGLFASFPIEIRFVDRPKPCLPEAWMDLMPSVMKEQSLKRQKRHQVMRLAAGVAVCFGLGVMGFIGHTGWLWWQYHVLSRSVMKDDPEVQMLRRVAEKWDALAPAIDPSLFALETFYRCARHLPKDRTRFTLFQIEKGSVLIVGEADDMAGAVEFENRIASDLELKGLRWEIPPPRILANNIARFEIVGRNLEAKSAIASETLP